MKRFIGMALLATALAMPGSTAAQTSVASVIGDTVRVTAPAAGERIRGVLVAVRDDSLFVRRYGRTLAVPLARVERVDVKRRRSHVAGLFRGVLYGAPIGLASGYLAGTLEEKSDDDGCGDDCGLLPVVYGAAGFVTGTFFGGLIGVAAPGGRWQRVSSRPVMAVAPARGGVALSLTKRL